jgi:hypothetical protein
MSGKSQVAGALGLNAESMLPPGLVGDEVSIVSAK